MKLISSVLIIRQYGFGPDSYIPCGNARPLPEFLSSGKIRVKVFFYFNLDSILL